jgi:branched-chain amino acid transport system substrate-binding protein
VRRALYVAGVLGVLSIAVVAAGCGGGGGGGTTSAQGGGGGGGGGGTLPSSSCKSLYYQGSGSPDYIIASDLPLQGSGRTQTIQMGQAIRFVLKQNNFKAGSYTIGYQECDDSTAQEGTWSSGKCTSNARSYANTKSVIGVIGTFNSGCAKLEIPILNRAPGGPLAMISPANTYVGLTHSGPGTVSGEPDIYYPTGKRNYIRLVAADDFQGAADAILAQQLGLKNVYVLNDKQTYGLGVATNFKNAYEKLNAGKIAGFAAWDAKASSYASVASKIKQTNADAVFVGGLVCEQGGKLIKDLRNGLGPDVTLLAPDGFTPISAVVKDAGQAAEGLYVSVAGQPNEKLGGKGKAFVRDFGKQVGSSPDPYSAYAGQSAQVLLEAIAKSDGSRASVAANLFKTDVKDGILGSFKINANGDTNANPVTVYRVKNGQQTTYKTITPPTSLVKSA